VRQFSKLGMILEVARKLDDLCLDLFRCGHSCLDFRRIKWRRLRNAGGSTPARKGPSNCTEKTGRGCWAAPSAVVCRPYTAARPLVPRYTIEIHLPPLGRRNCRTPPDLNINTKIVNRRDYFEDVEDGLCLVCDRL
jgi:hypothetical protein